MNTEIRVGIKTKGIPTLKRESDHIVLGNMLIGDGFHWEKVIQALLPGKVEKMEHISHNISLINTLPLETYLECVVGSEMNPKAPLEFLRAHAVISRSWALGKILKIHSSDKEGQIDSEETLIGWDDTSDHHGFDVCSDDHCQRYQGIQPISDRALEAIQSTAHEVLMTSNGELIDARFSKCCGGITEKFSTCWQSREPEGLESIRDPWCNLSDLSSNDKDRLLTSILKDFDRETEGYGYRWNSEITKKEISENLERHFGKNIGEIKSMIPLHRGASDRIDLLRIEGSEGTLKLGKELWIRRILSSSHLYSSAFEVKDSGDKFRLEGKGWGHGVGLCQIGAANMAFNGKNYKEILEFYYPGSILKVI